MGGIPWTKEEDQLLRKCIEKYGEGKWHRVPLLAGLNRCRKSCRLRWLNYLRPNIKRGSFEEQEVELIIKLHRLLGNRWSLVASRLPGRTGNDVKNYWNCHLSKKLMAQETDRQQKKTSSHAKNDNVQPSNPTNSKRPVPSLVEDKVFQPLEEKSSASMAMLCNINEDHGQSQIFEAEDNGNNNIPCVEDQEDDGNKNDFMGNLATVDLDQFEQITINQFEQEVNSNKWDWDDSILDTDLWSYK